MSSPTADELHKAFRADNKAFQESRAEQDRAALALLERYARALFHAHPNLSGYAYVAYQGELDRLEFDVLVDGDDLSPVWQAAKLGDRPANSDLGPLSDEIRQRVLPFGPTLARTLGKEFEGFYVAWVRGEGNAVKVAASHYYPGY